MALAPFLWSFCPLRAGLAEECAPGTLLLAESRAVRHRASAASSKRLFLIFPPIVWLMCSDGRRGNSSRREVFDAREQGVRAGRDGGGRSRTHAHLELRGKGLLVCGQESGL